jgi:hypothetical protein
MFQNVWIDFFQRNDRHAPSILGIHIFIILFCLFWMTQMAKGALAELYINLLESKGKETMS